MEGAHSFLTGVFATNALLQVLEGVQHLQKNGEKILGQPTLGEIFFVAKFFLQTFDKGRRNQKFPKNFSNKFFQNSPLSLLQTLLQTSHFKKTWSG
jgi:hypothetical protein